MVTEATAFVSPGRRTVQVFPFLAFAPEDGWMQKVGTGKIALAVTQGPGEPSAVASSLPAKPAEPVKDNLKDVAWGAPADGLQAGVRIAGKKRVYVPGERVMTECFLRNVTDDDIPLAYAVRMYMEELPIVHSAANPGVERKMQGVFLTGLDPAFLLLLKRRETIAVTVYGFVLGDKPLPLSEPNDIPKGLEKWPYLENPAVGQYTVQQPVAYRLSTEAEVKRLAERSHAKDRLIIEPFTVSLLRPDGSRYAAEATTIPVQPDQSPPDERRRALFHPGKRRDEDSLARRRQRPVCPDRRPDAYPGWRCVLDNHVTEAGIPPGLKPLTADGKPDKSG